MRIKLILLLIYLIYYLFIQPKIKDKIQNIGKQFLINIANVLTISVLIISLLYELDTFHRIFDKLIESSTLLVAVLGFTLQNTIRNVIAGTLITYSGAFKLGDRVTLVKKDITGYIEGIALRHTIIRTYTNQRVIVPNSVMNDEIVINNDLLESRISYPIGFEIDIESATNKAIEIMEEVINKYSSKKTEVLCSDISNKQVTLKAFLWTAKTEASFREASKARLEILEEFKNNNIYKANKPSKLDFE